MSDFPRITFGIIVLNGEPFIRYALQALYPYAHEIIVVEGAAPGAKNIATDDGHSRDATLETLRQFQAEADPDRKLTIVTRDGFWTEKDEMSQAYAERATGDYLWQVDVDEFYQPDDMRAVIQILKEQPAITAVSFKTLTFWGAPDYVVDSWYLRRGTAIYHRLFKWGPGYTYATHRPPTVTNPAGQDLREGHWLRAETLEKIGIRMYHYSLLLPKQVMDKCDYYSHADWVRRQDALEWANQAYLSLNRPFHLHNVDEYPGCLYRYKHPHPPQVMQMWQAITAADSDFEIRQTKDIEALLNSPRYKIGRSLVMLADKPSEQCRVFRRKLKGIIACLLPRAIKNILKSR